MGGGGRAEGAVTAKDVLSGVVVGSLLKHIKVGCPVPHENFDCTPLHIL